MVNNVEGYDRRVDKEFVRFLNIPKGSLAEVKSHLYVDWDLNYVKEEVVNELFSLINEIGKLLSGLMGYLRLEAN